MIAFFVGTPGSGKSYEAVKKIVDNLKMGRTVCTNIDGMEKQECQEYLKNMLDMDDFTFRQRFRYLTKEEVLRFWETEKIIDLKYRLNDETDMFEDLITETEELICPAGSLIVIDEVHKFFNARDWQKDSNRKIGDWASTHRHKGYDLVLITQDIDKVDKQVRSLTEWCYFFRKVNFLGSLVKQKYMCYSYSGDDHNGKPLASNTRTYQPEYFPCYSSYSTADAKEVGFMAHTNILKHPIFYAIPILLVFTLFMFFKKSSFASGDFLGNKAMAERNKTVVAQLVKTPVPAVPVMRPISSATRSSLPVIPLLPGQTTENDYIRYPVTAVIIDGQKTIIQINGLMVTLPNPNVQSYSRIGASALARSSVFGPSSTPHQPVML